MRRLIFLAAIVIFLVIGVAGSSSIAYALDDYEKKYGSAAAPDQSTEAALCPAFCESKKYVSGKPYEVGCEGDYRIMDIPGEKGCCCSPKKQQEPLPVTSTPECQKLAGSKMKGVCATDGRYPGKSLGECKGNLGFCYAVDPDTFCNDACKTGKYLGGRCLPFSRNKVLNEFTGDIADYVDVVPIGEQFCNIALEGRLGMPDVPGMCYCGGVGFGITSFVNKVYAECVDMGNGQSNVVFSFMWGGLTATSAAVSADGGTSQSYYKARIGDDFQYAGDVRTDFYQSVVPSTADKKVRITVNVARGSMPYSYGSYGNSKYSQPGYGSAYGSNYKERYYPSYTDYSSNPAYNANSYGSNYNYGNDAYSRSFTVQCTYTGSKQGTTEFAYDKAVDELGGYTGREALAAAQEETGLPAQLIEKIYCTASGTRTGWIIPAPNEPDTASLAEAVASIASLLETEGVESTKVQDAIKVILKNPKDYTNVLLAATGNTDACLIIMSKKQTVYGIEVTPRSPNRAFIFEDLIIDGTRVDNFYKHYASGASEGQALFRVTDVIEGRVVFFNFAENNGLAAVPKDIKPYVYAPIIKTAVDKMNKDLGQHIAVTGSLVTIEGQAGFFESLCYGGKSICADFKSVGCKTDFFEAKCGSFPPGYKKISGNCGGFWGGVLGKAVVIAASLYLGDAVGGAVSNAVGGAAGEALGQFASAMVRQEIAKVTGVMAPSNIYGLSGSMPNIGFTKAEKNDKCEFWAGENPTNAPECKGYSLSKAWEEERGKLITMIGYAAVNGQASGICVGKKVTETSCKPVAAQPPSYSYCGGLVTIPYPADPAKPEESAMGIWPCRYYCSREGMTTIGNLTVNIGIDKQWTTDVSTADAGKFTYMFLAPTEPGAYTLSLTSNIKPYKGFAEDVSLTVTNITLIVREPEKPKVEIVRSECGAEDEALNCKDKAYQCGTGEKIYYKIRITNPVDEDVTHDQTDFAIDIAQCTERWACELRDRVLKVEEGVTEETVLSMKPPANAEGTGEAKIQVRDPVHYGEEVDATASYLYHEKKPPVMTFSPASLSGDLDHPQEIILNITNKDNAKCNGDRFSVFTTAPENWQITMKKDGNLVESVVVKAGATESLNVKIVPKKTATGKQSILFSLMRGTRERLLSSVENVRDFKVYANGRYAYFNEAGVLKKMATGEQPQEISSNVVYFDVDEKTAVFDPATFETIAGETSIYIGPEYPSIPAVPGKIILTPYGNKWNFVSLTNVPDQALKIKDIEGECGPVKIWKYGGADTCSGPDVPLPCQFVYGTTTAAETVSKDISRNLGYTLGAFGNVVWVTGIKDYGTYSYGGSGFIVNDVYIDIVDRSGTWPIGEQIFTKHGDEWEWCWKGGTIPCSSLSKNGETLVCGRMKVKITKESGKFRVQQWGDPCNHGGIKFNAYSRGNEEDSTAAEEASLVAGEAYLITVSKKCNIETIGRDYSLAGKSPHIVTDQNGNKLGYFAGPTEPIEYNKIRGTCPEEDVKEGPFFYNQLSKTWEFTTLVEPGRGYFINTTGCTFHRSEETDDGIDPENNGVLTIDGKLEYKDQCVSGKLVEYYSDGVLEDLNSPHMSDPAKSFSYGLTVTGTEDYITDWKTLFAVNTPAFHDGDLNSQGPGKIWLVNHNQQLQVNSDGSWKIITDKKTYGLFDLKWNGKSWISSNELHSGTFSFENKYPSEPVAFDVAYIGDYTMPAEPIAVSGGTYRKPSSGIWRIEDGWNNNGLFLTGQDSKDGRAGFFYTVRFQEHINQEIKATLSSQELSIQQDKVSFSEGEKLIADKTIQLVFSAPRSVVKEIIKAGLKIDIKDDNKYVKVWGILDNENAKYTETSTTCIADVPVHVYACIDEDQNDVCDYQETVQAKSITKSCDEFCAEENPFMVGSCKEDQFGVGHCACKPKPVPNADVYYIYAREGEQITYELVKSSAGRTTILATGLESPKDIAVGSEYIYWTEFIKGVIYKVPKKGGAVAVEKTGLVNPVGLDYRNGNLTYTEIGLKGWTIEAPVPATAAAAVPEVYYAAPSWYSLEGKRSLMIVGDRTTKIKQAVGVGTFMLHARSDETVSIAVSINGVKAGTCSVSTIWTACSFNVSAGELAIYPDTDKKTIVFVDDVSAVNGGFEEAEGKVVGATTIAVKNPMDVSVDNDMYSTSYS
ncbi:MAG: hypothetical protein HZB66_03225, partial [Candidatus Aenigmarchaeota archaeon]|nr:hypothetical protein [Candidatus Aenigmarchaeota archaeon]